MTKNELSMLRLSDWQKYWQTDRQTDTYVNPPPKLYTTPLRR